MPHAEEVYVCHNKSIVPLGPGHDPLICLPRIANGRPMHAIPTFGFQNGAQRGRQIHVDKTLHG